MIFLKEKVKKGGKIGSRTYSRTSNFFELQIYGTKSQTFELELSSDPPLVRTQRQRSPFTKIVANFKDATKEDKTKSPTDPAGGTICRQREEASLHHPRIYGGGFKRSGIVKTWSAAYFTITIELRSTRSKLFMPGGWTRLVTNFGRTRAICWAILKTYGLACKQSQELFALPAEIMF